MWVSADAARLEQVVVNLLTNAVKFTGSGGSIAVAASLVGDEVVVTVRDTGVGIAPDHQQRIFEAFQRGDRRASVEGTGLGLTLSKRFVELHGGRIWVESEPGVGSTFAFAIPVGQFGEEFVSVNATPDPSTVLVIEDDRRSAELFELYLSGAGYAVQIASDGAEGLELARALRPRAVILDILLPRIDGWDLLTRLKADPATAGCPVVVVSMLDERGKGLSLGAAEYLIKPVSREAMLDALAAVL
jgi:CheY-like chemotaxis protein